MWISGSPGSGKSAIISSLVSKLTREGRLGSSFFFKRGDAILEDPASFWRTVAFDLAQFHPAIKSAVIAFLNRPGFRDADIQLHFECMIEDILRSNSDQLSTAPPVVVADALDECGSEESQTPQRRALLETLHRWSVLPRFIKLIVTSRDERMPRSFNDPKICRKITLETGESVTPETRNDIRIFLERSFDEIRPELGLRPTWPGEAAIRQLTERSAGLFIWANTTIAFIKSRSGNPTSKLKLVLAGNLGTKSDIIDTLYHNILVHHFHGSDRETFDMFNKILGAIIVARIPLRCSDLEPLLGIPDEDDWSFNSTLNKLSSVIDLEDLIRFRHLSFAEFLVDPSRCRDSRFLIKPSEHHLVLTRRCLEVMNSELRFNICSLPTSCLPNDSNTYDPTSISPCLSYSCRFWVDHLQLTTFHDRTADKVCSFLHTKFLFWLEVLSLIKEVPIALSTLPSIVKWSQVSA
jgi:hypothetical protein